MKKIISTFTYLSLLLITISAFKTADTGTDEKSKSLLDALYKTNGGWKTLWSKKDVQFTYTYNDFKKGTDISTEKYIFDGESSWAEYQKHEVNVMPGMPGTAVQSLVMSNPKLTLAGKEITDKQAVGGTQFLRTANFFWFTMMYKLDDPGTSHKYLGQEKVKGIMYDKVSLTYIPEEVGKEVNDAFVLYFNPKTHLVDQFLFSLPAWGVNEPVLKMELDYEQIDGVYIATKRRAYMPDETGKYNQFGEFSSDNIKFNNGFTHNDLKI